VAEIARTVRSAITHGQEYQVTLLPKMMVEIVAADLVLVTHSIIVVPAPCGFNLRTGGSV
jgi:hypothetical protein